MNDDAMIMNHDGSKAGREVLYEYELGGVVDLEILRLKKRQLNNTIRQL